MKCVVCHGDRIEPTTVKETIQVGSDLLFVSVETPVCQTCGERYYDRRTVQYLEDVEADARAGRGTLREVGKLRAYDK